MSATGESARRWFWPTALLVIVLGSALRLWRLDLAEFKADEVAVTGLVLALVQHGRWPAWSVQSSLGTRNPPAFLYMEAVPALVSPTPLALTAFVAVLNCCALAGAVLFARRYFGDTVALVGGLAYATAPWAVVYSRKIWEQDALPPLVLLFFVGLFAVVVDRRPVFLLLCGFAAGVALQLHTSSVALVAIAGVAFLLWPGRFPLRYVATGAVAALLPLLPYLIVERRIGFSDWLNALHHAGTNHPDRLADTASAWQLWTQVSSGWQVAGLLGPERSLPGFVGSAGALGWLFAGAGLVTVMIGTLYRTVWATDRSGSAAATPDARLILLFLWMVVPPWALGLSGLPLYSHYFIVSYPAPFLAIGVLVARLRCRGAAARIAMAAALTALTAANVATLVWLLRVAATLPPHAEYGLPLAYSEQAVAVIARDASGRTMSLAVDPAIRDGTTVIGQLLTWQGLRVVAEDDGATGTPCYWVLRPQMAIPPGARLLRAIGPAGAGPVVLVWETG